MLDLDTLDFDRQGGLVTVVAQDATTGAVLMVAHADREALERTIASGEMHYRSRTRGPWHKGATSGNVQRVVALAADCDGDSVLALVRPAGPACHTGATSCFEAVSTRAGALSALDATIAARAGEGARGAPPENHDAADTASAHHQIPSDRIDPSPTAPSYTRRLLADRNLRLKKLGEEAAELVLACADEDRPRAAGEAADLLYHTLVALRALGLGLDDVRTVLEERAGGGGRK